MHIAFTLSCAVLLSHLDLCSGKQPHTNPKVVQEPPHVAKETIQESSMWSAPMHFLQGKPGHQDAWHQPAQVKFLPDEEERMDMNKFQHQQRTAFYVCVFVVITVVSVLAMETIRLLGNCFVRAYKLRAKAKEYSVVAPLEVEVETASNSPVPLKVASSQTLDFPRIDIFFIWYKATYEWACFSLMVVALRKGYLDPDSGVDFELYVLWLVELLLVHTVGVIVCLVWSYKHDAEPVQSVATKVGLSLLPFVSERWNLLRDYVTMGIYISEYSPIGYLAASIVACSLICCNVMMFRTPSCVKSLRNTYWPITEGCYVSDDAPHPDTRSGLMHPPSPLRRLGAKVLISHEPDSSDSFIQGLFLKAVRQMDKATQEHKRINTLYGELPQALASALFVFTSKASTFVVVCFFMYIIKVVMLFLIRPYVLCLLARFGEPWEHVIREDFDRVLASRRRYNWVCPWQLRCIAAQHVVTAGAEHISAISGAVEGMGRLFAGHDDDDDDDIEEGRLALIEFLRKFLKEDHSDAAQEFRQCLARTILSLCPGLVENDLHKAVPSSGGNLGYYPTGPAIKDVKEIVESMHAGERDLNKLLREKRSEKYAKTFTTNDDELMVAFTDMEPDDSMAIAQLWQWKVQTQGMGIEPMVILSADFADKDKGAVFEKKLITGQLMLGLREDIHVLTPDQEYNIAKSKRGAPQHPQAEYWATQRQSQINSICEKLANFKGSKIHLYIMAPGHGNLAAIAAQLQKMGKWPLPHSWKISVYSGQFNMQGMFGRDLDVIKEIASMAQQPLADAAKFPFFGGKNAHPCTSSFTTFAPDKFACELNLEASPLLIAALKLLNDEHNAGLVAPEKLFRDRPLTEREKTRLDRHKQFYESDIGKYCKGIVDDFALFAKVVEFKKSIVVAFAFGCCDSPLCDQLLFVQEYLHTKMRAGGRVLMKDLEPGKWMVDSEKGYTKVDTKATLLPSDAQAIQPALQDAMDEHLLQSARDALQEYLLKHLKCLQ